MSLVWKRSAKVEGYESADGVWVIEHQEAYTSCENPHPMGKGKPRCEGGEEHAYMLWVLWRDHSTQESDSERIDAGPTLRQMKEAAETAAAKEAQ